MNPIAGEEPVSERRKNTGAHNDRNESRPVHTVVAPQYAGIVLLASHGSSSDANFDVGRGMLMMPKGYEKAQPGTMPDANAVAAMMKYNEALQKAGVLLALDGLHPPSMGARVTFSGGKPEVTDGPFTEAKEVIGGYWMIQVKSKEEAVEWASRCPASDNEVIEIRQVLEMTEFPAEVQEAAAGFSELPGSSSRKMS